MPKYKVEIEYSETHYYSGQLEVEADSEEEAEDEARDRMYDGCCECQDSEINGRPVFTTKEINPIPEIHREYINPTRFKPELP